MLLRGLGLVFNPAFTAAMKRRCASSSLYCSLSRCGWRAMSKSPKDSGGNDTRIGAAFIAFAASSGIELNKIKSPKIILPIPPSLLPFLAQIAVLWGFFERKSELLLIALLTANNDTSNDWQRFSFEQKCDSLKINARSSFAEHHSLLAYVSELLTDARVLQFRRNLLLHGNLSISAKKEEGVITIKARGRKRGRPVEEIFTSESIKQLAYDLAHLAGRMASFSPPWLENFFPTLSSPDKSFLRDFLSSYHPDRTNPAIPDGPLRSSQE
jgi:hypothetical protein